MSAIKKISGYKGHCTHIAAGGMEFFIVAANVRDLETIYNSVLEDAEAFSREDCRAVVIISADDLPRLKKAGFTEPAIEISSNETNQK